MTLQSILQPILRMSKIQCYGCMNPHLEEFMPKPKPNTENNHEQSCSQQPVKETLVDKGSSKVTFKLEGEQNEEGEEEISIYFRCECCGFTYCLRCCKLHMKNAEGQLEKKQNLEETEGQSKEKPAEIVESLPQAGNKKIKVVCQQCESQSSLKYCENCEQFLCEKCSFKIHNKGKRAKHALDENLERYITKNTLAIFTKDILSHLKEQNKGEKKLLEALAEFVKEQLKIKMDKLIIILQEQLEKECADCNEDEFVIKYFNPEEIKYEDLLSYKHQFPFIDTGKIIITNKDCAFHKSIIENYENRGEKSIQLEVVQEYKKKLVRGNHERVNSQKIEMKHTKNFSNFSNLSAISKVENQSVLSNEQSDLFESNELSLNITMNQNSSILMMGALSDRQKQEKQQRKVEIRENDKLSGFGQHRIYSIRQENSHNQANNLSTSTENSIRKRNKKWPIPYFQPFRVPKYLGGVKYNAQVYLRELAEKGILMIRRQKAQEFLQDCQISRSFVRNIGEKQIEYIAYIIDYLSVQCLAWVIESIKQDKMTPSEKLIQSRLKQSFQLKINMKLWDSIVKYLQSPQYDQDYFENTKVRYVPKISVVKYGQQFLLEFQERKWAYEDQQLLDQEEEEWKQFKQLITDYFNDRSQITGGRYGCVQYVKLNGPKPLRKCSLGKLSMYVQQAINKGIIRYHKTLLVSNSQNNTSMCSNANGIITNTQQLAQFQKDIKIMALQIGLVDMFLQSPPSTPISMAQIPLNLKNKVLFDYNLVELGFPKLKNLMTTLNDKLILQSTKTHTTYQTSTNGSQAIQKLRNKLAQSSQRYLAHILTYINLIITHYQSITLEDLYNQLTLKLGFPFDFKIYNVPDFYQFSLYYCSQIINVQFISGMFLAYSKYPTMPYHQPHQTHRTTYSQDQYPTYGNNYQVLPTDQYSRTTQKKHSQLSGDFESYQYPATSTPKFNVNYEKKKIDPMWEECYQDSLKKEDKVNEDYDFDDKVMEENINNILDESASHPPKTVIVNDGSEFNNPNQLYLCSKNQTPVDENDSFYGVWGEQNAELNELNKYGKVQHIRVKSTSQPAAKHSRVYSTTEAHK